MQCRLTLVRFEGLGYRVCVDDMNQVKQFERGVFGGEGFYSFSPAQHPLEKRADDAEV